MKKWRESKVGKGIKYPQSKNLVGLKAKGGKGVRFSQLKKKIKNEKIRTKLHIKKILVPLDGSKKSIRALDEAIVIAIQFEASITGLNVTPIIPLGNSRLVKKLKQQEIKKGILILKKGEKLCQKHGITFSSKIMEGYPGPNILKMASSKKFDLIVMGSGGKGIAKEILLGSVSNHVLHKSKTPVLIVK